MVKLLGPRPKPEIALPRRTLLGAASAALAGGPLLLTPGKAKASTVIRYADEGGENFEFRRTAYLEPFQRATGVEVRHYIGQQNLAKVRAMVQTRNIEFDMVNDLGTTAEAAARLNLTEHFDRSRIDVSRLMFPNWLSEGSAAWLFYTGGIAYDTSAPRELPKSWADYWNVQQFPGRRGLLSRPQETLEQALLADGVAPAQLYPLDLNRAYRSLDKIKPEIRLWIRESAKSLEYLQTRELDFTYTTAARVLHAKANGMPVDFIRDMPISAPQSVYLVKGASNADACMQLAAFFLNNADAALAFFSQRPGYGPTDRVAFERLPAELRAQLPDPADPKATWIDAKWWGANLAAAEQRHRLWLLR